MLKTVYIFACVLFITIYTCQYFSVALPHWVNNYVNDFLCMPVVLTMCRKITSVVAQRPDFRLNLFMVLSVTIYFAVYFEFIMPRYNLRYTADFIDVILYFTGALLYYTIQEADSNKHIATKKE